MRKSIFALASLLAVSSVFGQATINKADNSDNLNLTTSWTGGVIPTLADIARWNSGVTGASTTSLGADLVFGQIAIVDLAGLVTINGANTLTLSGVAGVGIDMSAATQNLTLGMTGLVLGANQSWNIASGRILTVNAVVSGSGALTKAGTGTAILSQANTYTGATTVSAGVINIQNASALGTTAGGTTVASGAALELQGGIVVAGEPLNLTGTGISSGGGLRNISGDNSFNGLITLGGTASIISDSGLLTLDPSSGNAITAGANALTMGGAGDITVNDAISSTGTFTKIGTGTLTIGNATTPSGATAINGGVLNLTGSGQLDGNITVSNAGSILRISAGTDALASNVDVTLNAGTFFEYNSTTETLGALAGSGTITRTLTGTGTLTLNSGNETSTFTGLIENGSGTIGITKTGTGTLTMTGAHTFTGTLLVANGAAGAQSLVISGANASLATATINVGDNNGGLESLTVGSVGDVVAGTLNRLADTGNITLNGSTTGGFTYVGPAVGSGGNVETIGTLTASAGRNTVTLVPGTGNEVQLTTGSIARTNTGTLLIRGASLGGTGEGSTRLLVTTTTGLLTGSGGADGTTTKSIIRFAIGDTSATGAGSGFLTHDATLGVRLLTAGEYDTTLSGSNAILRNVSTAGETLTTTEIVNGLRLTNGGTLTIAAGERLTVTGAVLMTDTGTATNGSITGPGTLDFGTTEGIVHLAQASVASTGSITARIAGTAGLTYGRSGDAASTLELGGDNTVIGTLTINMGTVRLTSDTALNDNFPMTVLGRAATVLQLNGSSVTLRDLQAGGGGLTIENASSTAATLTTYLTAGRTISTTLQNGTGGGALSLVVSGGNTLTIEGDASATGTFELRSGTVDLTNTNGTLNDFASYTVSGGTLRMTNTSSANNGNRVSGGAVTLNAGTLDFNNNASDASFAETVGAVTLNSGASTITVDRATTTNARTSVLTLASLARSAGSTVNFTSQNNNTAVYDLGTTVQSRIAFTTDPTLDDGILGGWATIESSATTREFAKFVTGANESITSLVAGDYTTALSSGANAAQNVKLTASPAALTSSTQINSLNLQQAGATTVGLGGNVLRVESGGILVNGSFNAAISNGTLTAGTGTNGAGEVIVHAYNGTIASSGITFTNSSDTLTKSGVVNGSPIVFSGTAPGGLSTGVTYYAVNSNGTTFQVAGTVGGAAIAITADGTTAAFTETTMVTLGAVIADNGSGMVSFTKAGTGMVDLSGVTNTYTGSTYLNGGTLRIDNNNNLGAPAAGQTLTLSGGAVLEVTNSTTLSAGRGIVVGPGSNVISVASGAGTAGKVVTYNGSITGLGTTEGSLHLRSNPVATTGTDPGDFNGTLSSLSLGGTFRFDAGAITVTNATNTIGRSLQVGADGVGSLTFNSAGGALTVGQGINDTLDVGVVSSDVGTSNSLLSNGTLDVSAFSQFTANTSTIRIGIGGGANRIAKGSLLLATNSDLTAGTSILVSSAGGPSQVGNESLITFGSGVSNVTTPLFTLGGLKGDGRATVQTGGTVNLNGFAANTMDLYIGRNIGNTGTISEGDFVGTGGTINASLDELALGVKASSGNGGSVGVLTLGTTSNNWSVNSIILGSVTGNSGGTATTSGTLTFGGGTFVVNNDLAMATYGTNTGNTAVSVGRLNITGGTFTIAGNITRTTDNPAQSSSFITVDGGTLDMQNQAADDTTAGSITASQLAFRSGSITDVANATLQAISTTNSGVAGTTGDALIVRDVTLSIPTLAITGATGGNIHYEAAGGGAGGTISGNVDLGAGTRTVNVENSAGTTAGAADLTLSGAVSNGGITKTNTGVLLLTGTNTYAGATTVSAGTLQVGAGGVGSLAAGSAVSVSGSGAVLAGTGTINGSVTMTQGTLRPGDSAGEAIGTLSTGALAFTPAAAQTVAELQILAPGSADKLSISGALTLSTNGNFVVLPASYTATRGDSFTLMEWTGLLTLNGWTTGPNYRDGAGDTGADLDLPDISSSGLVWEISSLLDGNTGGSLVIVVVPEPGRALLLGISVAFLLMRRRRR